VTALQHLSHPTVASSIPKRCHLHQLSRLNTSFGTAGKEHKKFIYNNAAFLLTLAIADNALFGLNSLEDVRNMEIPSEEIELILRFNDDALKKSILRKYTKAKGVTDKPISKTMFLNIYQNIMKNAEYLNGDSIYGHQTETRQARLLD
jgi:hypothetical protein